MIEWIKDAVLGILEFILYAIGYGICIALMIVFGCLIVASLVGSFMLIGRVTSGAPAEWYLIASPFVHGREHGLSYARTKQQCVCRESISTYILRVRCVRTRARKPKSTQRYDFFLEPANFTSFLSH